MGAQQFSVTANGKTADEAFRSAVDEAYWEYGHGGYTGTIAEKDDFALIQTPEGEDPNEFAERLLRSDDPRIADKWGPAGCVKIDDETWLFFGWASS